MDLEFFLKERIRFTKYFYDTGIKPFKSIIHAIENKEPPYVPEYSEEAEPQYLSDWIDANTGIYTIGYTAISMLSASLKLFLNDWKKRLEKDYTVGFEANFKKGLIPGYLKYFSDCGLDVNNCGVNLELLEQIVLARNNIQHPDELTTLNVKFDKSIIKKFPQLYFVDHDDLPLEEDLRIWHSDIKPSEEHIQKAINSVEVFCTWLEEEFFDRQT